MIELEKIKEVLDLQNSDLECSVSEEKIYSEPDERNSSDDQMFYSLPEQYWVSNSCNSDVSSEEDDNCQRN